MRVICTGISGTGRMELLRHVVGQAEANGLDVALFDVRETMFEIARDVGEPVDEETILDMFPRALVLLRAAALEKICSAIETRRPRHWVLNTHAVFRWKNSLISGFDPHYLSRLDPHLFATVTAGVKTTLARLRSQPRWAPLSEDEVLIWREEEQFASEEMARIHRKPQVLLPSQTAEADVYRLFFEPRWKKAYLSYPMQHVPPETERGLQACKTRLQQSLVVFDPADVNDFAVEHAPEALPGDGSAQLARVGDREAVAMQRDRLQQHIADQIVVRDYKLIQQSDLVVVFYDVPVPSPGVISEMKFALESGKRVYGVWLPPSEPGVFFTRYCSVWFRGVEPLFEYFRRHRVTSAPSSGEAAASGGAPRRRAASTAAEDRGAGASARRAETGRRSASRAEREAEQVARAAAQDSTG